MPATFDTTKRSSINGVAMNESQLGTVRAFARDGYRVAGLSFEAVVLSYAATAAERFVFGRVAQAVGVCPFAR